MQLSSPAGSLRCLSFVVNLGIGFLNYRCACDGVSEYFISGGDVPWWLAGTSMVATTMLWRAWDIRFSPPRATFN
jgi:SSS family solute:Na+ symporter